MRALREMPFSQLAAQIMCCESSAIHALPRDLAPFTRTWRPADALRVVAERRWTSEHGPMVSRKGFFDELGVKCPPWHNYADVITPDTRGGSGGGGSSSSGGGGGGTAAGSAEERYKIHRSALLDCGPDRLQTAHWVVAQFAKPPSERKHRLSCIHWVTPQDTTTSADDPIAGMPPQLREANLAHRWWPASATGTFLLLLLLYR